jgi:hypothetical protein
LKNLFHKAVPQRNIGILHFCNVVTYFCSNFIANSDLNLLAF